MKVYLVGGAVRDKLLGLVAKEKDWVVVGSTPQKMKDKGYKQVGKDFPVFINPKTGEEYALARTERKSGHGYTGFEFDTNPNVTLEEDLERRDLTINAIAQDEYGTLIDPFNGQDDIKNKKLRHVSNAFSEDPLRVLRLARFKAKFPEFSIVPETMNMVGKIADSGELEHLTGERVWLEMYKSNDIGNFFYEVHQLDIIKKILGLRTMPPLNDHTRNVIKTREFFLHMYGNKFHEISRFIYEMVNDVDTFCDELKIPNDYREMAKMLKECERTGTLYEIKKSDYEGLLNLVDKLDIRKIERLNNFFQIVLWSDDFKIFLNSLIEKIKNFRLNEKDQKKSKDEIIQIIRNNHKEIAQDHISEYLNDK